MSLIINDIGVYLPEQKIGLERISIEPQLSKGEIKIYQRFYGLNRIAISKISLEEMMYHAAQDTLIRNGIAIESITLLIHAHTAPETWTYPNNLLSRLNRRLGLRNATCFSIHSNNCASNLNGLQVIQNHLIGNGGQGYALLLTADLTFSGILQQIPNTTLCGDAATACIISLGGDGAKMKALEIDYYGQHSKGSWQTAEEQVRFEASYAGRLANVMERCLKQSNLSWEHIRWVFPHNVNLISWRDVTQKIELPLSKVYLDKLPELGHCFGADIFINWNFAKDTLRLGDYVMVATVGLGAVFGAAIFQLVKEDIES
ncbi:ketoacyl-ACP synthase III family protein [Photorhabdus sp. CRCIA-P01]|uniref:ketoacyl-ACP synthase III family protein n=1 Tax=Photorhabdus sp. CRCIA-P01 TaxID=2019570 RepID=UPI000E5A06DA|nr:ketoacyl-ACP synthase III family protein [Photorhabdus sp. CRCIA-P01]